MFAFAHPRARRKPALTPLIDVVFLLLVFFMLAAQFGREAALPLAGGSGAGEYTGQPRLVTVTPKAVLLNGMAQSPERLTAALQELTGSPTDAIVLRARDGADVQHLSDVITLLSSAGFTRLILVE